ncbi:TPA: hypothetical protein ACX33O_004538 [Klebsiella pneumoniae]
MFNALSVSVTGTPVNLTLSLAREGCMQLEDYISAGRVNIYTDVLKLKPGEELGGYNWNKAVSTAMQPLMYDLNVRRSKELRKLLQGLGQQKIIRLTSCTRIIAIIDPVFIGWRRHAPPRDPPCQLHTDRLPGGFFMPFLR